MRGALSLQYAAIQGLLYVHEKTKETLGRRCTPPNFDNGAPASAPSAAETAVRKRGARFMAFRVESSLAAGIILSAVALACSTGNESTDLSEAAVGSDPVDVPITGVPASLVAQFNDGDDEFGA